jgi:4-amino-4-deoxy-L-arabinose transferase-like glycosyltransferase
MREKDIKKVLLTTKQWVVENIWAVLIGIIAIAIHLVALSEIPYGLHVDEIATGYDAWSLLHFGVDRYLKSFPVYLINFGGGQNSLYCYMCIPFIKLFGFTTFAIRMPAFVGACLLFVYGYKIVWEKWKNKWVCLMFLGLYTVIPIFLMSSRFGLESYLMLPFSTVFLYYCIKAMEENSIKNYVVCGIFGGVLLYTYALSYIVLPLFLILLLIYMIILKKIYIKQSVAFVIPLAILATPLILVQIVNRFQLQEFKLGIFTITKLPLYRSEEIAVSNILPNMLTLVKCILAYDWLPYNSAKQFGNLHWISIPFIIMGVFIALSETVQAFKKKAFDPTVLFVIWAMTEFGMGCLLGGNGPNTNKINGIFFCMLYFLIQGILYAVQKAGKWKKQAVVLLSVVYLFSGVSFMKYYFFDYKEATYPQHLFANEFDSALEYLNSLDETIHNRTTYIGNMKCTYIYFLGSTLTSPYGFDIQKNGVRSYKNYIFKLPDTIDENSNYIVRKTESDFMKQLEERGFQKVNFDEYTLYYMK